MRGTLTWMYRKLGARYPATFIVLELQSAFVIGVGAVALIGFYYEAPRSDVLMVMGLTCVLTAIAIGIVLTLVVFAINAAVNWVGNRR